MQVILLEKLQGLGDLGDIKTVRPGFARNFLIPQGKAKRATQTAIKEFEARRVELEKGAAQRLATAQSQGEKLTGRSVSITAKSGVDGRLFGSVTNFDIAEALKAQGFDVEKAQVRMPNGPLKMIGDHAVQIALHTDVVVDVTITVVGDHA